MVSIIILNYNGKEFLTNCLNSVLSQSYQDFEVIVYDNCSADGSLDFLKSNFVDIKIKIIAAEKNSGFAGGNNEALKYAKGDLIVLLNNDTIVETDWLSELVKCVSASDEIGMAQSLVLTEGIPLKYYDKNGTVNIFGHNIMEVFNIGNNGIGEIFQVNGCSLIIKREVLNLIGGLFLNEYFAYAEDTYLSFKVKFAGYKIIHNSKSVVHHIGSATMKKYKNTFVTFYQERNRLLNFLIVFSDSFRRKYYPLLLFNLLLKLTYSVFYRKYSFRGILKAYFWLLNNPNWVENERNNLKIIKRVKEDCVLKYISGKIANGDNFFEIVANKMLLFYLKLVNIEVIESE